VFRVLHFHNTPWIKATSDLLAFGFNQLVGSNHREWDAGLKGNKEDRLHTGNPDLYYEYKYISTY
jgi:hypothetical protein